MQTSILDSAFYHFLVQLSESDREHYLFSCFQNDEADLVYALARHYQIYHPTELAAAIEKAFHTRQFKMMIRNYTEDTKVDPPESLKWRFLRSALQLEDDLQERKS